MNLPFTFFSVGTVNLSRFAAVVVHQQDGSTVSVQNPSVLYTRADGRFTIKAKNPVNTATVHLRGATLTVVCKDGKTDTLALA